MRKVVKIHCHPLIKHFLLVWSEFAYHHFGFCCGAITFIFCCYFVIFLFIINQTKQHIHTLS